MIEPRTEDDASRDDVSLDVASTDRAAQDLSEQDLAAQDLAAHDVTAQAIARGARPASTPDAALQALFQDVEKRPWSHDFFALLRRIEGLSPHLPRLGRAARPSLEPIRLGEEAELDFAPAALAKLEPTGAGVPRLGVRFFGLLGPQGPLPLHLTEYARERQYQRNDPTLARFLDIFHHRLLMLFYRAWAQSQPAVQHDRPAADRYAAWLGAAAGLHGAWQPKDALPQTARLFNAGMMGSRGRHPEGLAKILSQHFQVAVRIDPHVPQWLPLEAEERTRLGFARNRGERIGLAPAALGRSTTVGTKTWDRQYRFRVVIGPLTREQYDRFLPDGSAWRPLNDWIRQYVGHSLRWDIQPVLERRAVPQASLGHQLRLGYTSWAGRTGRAMPANDRGDLRLRPWSVALGTAGRTHRTADPHTMRPPQGEQP